MSTLRTIRARRQELRERLDVSAHFEELEESCVPSYVHPNPAAAGVAWLRLVRAAGVYREHAGPGPILDFGSATGELYHVLGVDQPYDFCEANDDLAKVLVEMNAGARRVDIENLPTDRYAAIFALDSLEHNDAVDELLRSLSKGLRSDGVFILSGPTENWIYRAGRKLAGFSGHYHKMTILDIERAAERYMNLIERKRVPFGAPLFNISVWKRR